MVSGTQRRLECVEVDEAVVPDVEVRDLEAFALQFAHRVERRLVLGAHGDEVPALVLVEVGRALQREIDRFGGAGRPDQFLRVAADQRRDVSARLLDGRFGGPAERMRARRGIAEFLGQVGDHLLRDARVHRRRRRIVEIDRELHVHREMVFTAVAMIGSLHGGATFCRLPVVLQHRDVGGLLLRDQIGQRHAMQIGEDVLVEAGPQVVRHAAAVVAAIFTAAALRRVDRFVDGEDDLGDGHGVGRAGERVSAAGTARRCRRGHGAATCRTAAPGRTARCAGARTRPPESPAAWRRASQRRSSP